MARRARRLAAAAAALAAAPRAAWAAPPTVTLSNGVTMPRVADGTGNIGGAHKDDDAAETITQAFAAGFTAVDHAHNYNDAAGVAKALAGVDRSAYFLGTKVPGCGVNGIGPPSPLKGVSPPCEANTRKMALDNIAALGVKYVDLQLLHYPPIAGCGTEKGCAMLQQQWRALEGLYADGAARAIGVSNMCQACLECIARNATVTPHVNQLQLHIGMGPDPGGINTYCAARNISVQCFSPLESGRGGSTGVMGNSVVRAVAAKAGKSAAQVAMRWITQRGHSVVTHATNLTYLREDLDVFDWDIAEEDLADLDDVTKPECAPYAPDSCCK